MIKQFLSVLLAVSLAVLALMIFGVAIFGCAVSIGLVR
jgi:hypothetical protein